MPEIQRSIFNDSKLLNKHFDPDTIESPIVAICSHFSSNNEKSLRSKMHSHSKGQLIFVKSGNAKIRLEDSTCHTFSNQVIWIPSGLKHDVVLKNKVDFRAIYIDQKQFPQLPTNIETIFISPLIGEIIDTISSLSFQTNWFLGTEFHLQSILIRELNNCKKVPRVPEVPKDRRILNYLLAFQEKGEIPPRLNELVTNTGVSERTVHRLFIRDSGINYQKWRQQVRIVLSIKLLSTDKSITEIAHQLQFSTASAFISCFKSEQNITPNKYRKLLSEY